MPRRTFPLGPSSPMRSLGASKFAIYRDVIFPATVPDLFTALRITCGTAVAILFIAESMAGSSGLGYYIMHAWSLLEYARMFAGIVAMALLGVIALRGLRHRRASPHPLAPQRIDVPYPHGYRDSTERPDHSRPARSGGT
ncbi:MAG: ABC transporter permease subunit [Coriobacteriales bacterium]